MRKVGQRNKIKDTPYTCEYCKTSFFGRRVLTRFCSRLCRDRKWLGLNRAKQREYHRKYIREWWHRPGNHERLKKKNRLWYQEFRKKLRIKVFEKYGNKCVKCGFSDFRALQLDHVNGGGTKAVREYHSRGSRDKTWVYKNALKDNTDKYQLLCANCNWIKRFTHDELKPMRKDD